MDGVYHSPSFVALSVDFVACRCFRQCTASVRAKVLLSPHELVAVANFPDLIHREEGTVLSLDSALGEFGRICLLHGVCRAVEERYLRPATNMHRTKGSRDQGMLYHLFSMHS